MVNKTLDARLSDGTKISDLTVPEEGIISSKVWSDPEIFDLELKKVFAKTWNFVAHETEIPNTNDYVTRFVGNDRVIAVRTEDGVNVFLNACVHKGMHLCRQDHGNTKTFKCIYHGWTYRTNGTVAGVPAQKEAYGDTLDRNNYKLIQARVESYGGLIFATFNEEAPSLDEWLGDMKFYIDIYFNQTPQGMEVVGPPATLGDHCKLESSSRQFCLRFIPCSNGSCVRCCIGSSSTRSDDLRCMENKLPLKMVMVLGL